MPASDLYDTFDDSVPSSRAIQHKLSAEREILARLMRSDAVTKGDITAAMRQVTELAAELLRVERASVWFFDALHSSIECVELYERSKSLHVKGGTIHYEQAPVYFQALETDRAIAAENARTDPRTREFTSGYLEPLGIGAMLDAPIFSRGHMVGVVCHEHVGGPRRWRFWEELLAGTVADFVALVSEASERVRAERELGFYRDHLEQLVGLRTQDLEQVNVELSERLRRWQAEELVTQRAEQGIRELLDGSPVPLVLSTREGDILYVNQRAGGFFGRVQMDMIGRQTNEFYLRAEEQITLRAELAATGHVDGFVAELKTSNNQRRWALITAEMLDYQGQRCVMAGFSDITPQKLAEAAVRRSEGNIRKLFGAAPVALVLTRAHDNTVLLANQQASDLFEVPMNQVVGQHAPNFYVNAEERAQLLEHITTDGHVDQFTTRMRTRSGREFWATLSARLLELDGETVMMAGILDVTPQKELEAQLRELATKDVLTDVFNRRHFVQVASAEIERSRRHPSPLSLCMLDADYFKRINDVHGHATGDEALKLLARTAARCLRVNDVLARIGGEEFVALLPHTDTAGAKEVAERIRQEIAVQSIDAPDGKTVQFTVSGGVCELRPEDTLETFLNRADEALYSAKQAGRNQIAII
jgi:diguanylate cyclase (GGDEF)-like protein/PAS domain S-box-containing protein